MAKKSKTTETPDVETPTLSTPPPTQSLSEAFDDVQSLEAQIAQKNEIIKDALAAKLEELCDIYKKLVKKGATDILDRRHAKAITTLWNGLNPQPEPPSPTTTKPKAKRTRRSGGMPINEAILQVLGDGAERDILTIKAGVEKLIGESVKPASISQGLAKLKGETKIENPKRGFYTLKK